MKTREIELKMEVIGSLHEISLRVEQYLNSFNRIGSKIEGEGRDYFWGLNDVEADFVRLREMSDTQCELTTKACDKGSNFNRMELNCTIKLALEDGLKIVSSMLGPNEGTIYKTYNVYNTKDLVFCTYTVDGDTAKVFVEVEGDDEEEVIVETSHLKTFLKMYDLDVFPVTKSLYEMYVKPSRYKKN